MRYLPNGVQMSAADRHTIEEIGIPSLVLMERAALKGLILPGPLWYVAAEITAETVLP